MLPTGEEADKMEQSTLTYVFNLFGKGVTQILQTTVNQQTLIDELRSQVRSLQTQVSNLTASIDEIENRIFVRMQSMQPTIYTREGIPIDDALETINTKVQSNIEKIMNNNDTINRLDSELQNKLDKDDFFNSVNDNSKSNDIYSDLSISIQSLQKEVQRIRDENLESNEQIFQTMRNQLQQNN